MLGRGADRQQHVGKSATRAADVSPHNVARNGGNGNVLRKSTLGNLTPIRTNSQIRGGNTPHRQQNGNSFFDRSRCSNSNNVTTPIDRASESLEKINDVFRQISVGTFDAVSQIKRPQREDIDACLIFCRFVNALRPVNEQWDPASLMSWASQQSFMLYSPNC